MSINVRYAKKIPIMRYIVPFSYGHNGKKFDTVIEDIKKSGKWTQSTRSDLVPSHEEDLYDHVYSSLLAGKENNNNIGITFHPTKYDEKKMVYHYTNDLGIEKTLNFSIVDFGLYVFKTGIALYCYEIRFNDENKRLPLDELIIFQNRFKELNVLRGYQSKGKNHYLIWPETMEPDKDKKSNEDKNSDEEKQADVKSNKYPYYVLASDIAKDLNDIFGDVFYYPPRINEKLRGNIISGLEGEWKNKRNKYEKDGLNPGDRRVRKFKEKIEKEKNRWQSMSIEEFQEEFESVDSDQYNDEPKIVPDKAILFNYIVLCTDEELKSDEEKSLVIPEFCRSIYYLTRGYKFSYKVAADAKNERNNMFERHENDYWDASLEGIGDFILLYENLKDKNGNPQYNQFFDHIRANEMSGDYFILYILLLYQHYSIVYYSKKIAETVPGQLDSINDIETGNDELYLKLRKLKRELDLFMANSLFESVGQITDICNIYSYIENKLQIKKNIEIIKQGIDSINGLCNDLLNEKEHEKEKKTEKLISSLGFLALISIVYDAMSLICWFRDDWILAVIKIFKDEPVSSENANLIYCIISIVFFIVLVAVGVHTIRMYRKYTKKRS